VPTIPSTFLYYRRADEPFATALLGTALIDRVGESRVAPLTPASRLRTDLRERVRLWRRDPVVGVQHRAQHPDPAVRWPRTAGSPQSSAGATARCGVAPFRRHHDPRPGRRRSVEVVDELAIDAHPTRSHRAEQHDPLDLAEWFDDQLFET
jgi:hypothetical protein